MLLEPLFAAYKGDEGGKKKKNGGSMALFGESSGNRHAYFNGLRQTCSFRRLCEETGESLSPEPPRKSVSTSAHYRSVKTGKCVLLYCNRTKVPPWFPAMRVWLLLEATGGRVLRITSDRESACVTLLLACSIICLVCAEKSSRSTLQQ